MQIIQAGVTLVTLVDQRSYSLESINRNPLDLIISLVTMMRANEESEIKSQRIKAVFDVKRSQLSQRPWSARCPGWLRLNKTTSKFEIVQERADLVRHIFRMRLAGISQQSIVRKLNEERVPLFGQGNQRGKMWQKALIRHLLYTPTVVGTLVPFTTEWADGVRRLRPQTPVENYYPAIIERETGTKYRRAVRHGRRITAATGRKQAGPTSWPGWLGAHFVTHGWSSLGPGMRIGATTCAAKPTTVLGVPIIGSDTQGSRSLSPLTYGRSSIAARSLP
jgi:hypothetical protein